MLESLPYCGLPPAPGELLTRFNADPVLIAVLAVLAVCHIHTARPGTGDRARAFTGWLIASTAFVSPLCALSVSLFSARVAQHMLLILVAAPLIAAAWPRSMRRPATSWGLWPAGSFFFAALWFWHMPAPYDATFSSTGLYWTMHVTLFGSSILLWRELLHHSHERVGYVLLVGGLTSMQMGLLGAILTFSAHPWFLWHLTTGAAWGLTPLRDQQLGGVFMWVPGIALFMWAAIRSLGRLWSRLEGVKPA
jgi:putative membrane protein